MKFTKYWLFRGISNQGQFRFKFFRISTKFRRKLCLLVPFLIYLSSIIIHRPFWPIYSWNTKNSYDTVFVAISILLRLSSVKNSYFSIMKELWTKNFFFQKGEKKLRFLLFISSKFWLYYILIISWSSWMSIFMAIERNLWRPDTI